MRRLAGPLLLLALASPLLAPPSAHAADKKKDTSSDSDDVDLGETTQTSPDEFKEEDDEGGTPARLDSDDAEEKDPEDLDFSEEGDGEELDFGDDTTQETVKERGPGEDTAQLYRDAQKKYGEMSPDEELLRWEEYLKKYPKSLFRDRIEQRMDELSNMMFGERVEGSDRGEKPMDAALRELNFAVPQRFSGVDPQSHVQVGAELGIPNWFGLKADFEYQVMREWSAHGGIKRGLSGWELAAGTRYALIKSTRTGTVLSGGLDLNLNASPTFLGIQPMVNFGQRVRVMEGLDLQAQLAPVIELYKPTGVRYLFGFNAQLQANEVLAAFVESSNNVKYLGDDDVAPFYYLVTTFGLKFTPVQGKGEDKNGRLVIDIAASIPEAHNYWLFYQGSLQVGANYYF